jgi:hypothetical protein
MSREPEQKNSIACRQMPIGNGTTEEILGMEVRCQPAQKDLPMPIAWLPAAMGSLFLAVWLIVAQIVVTDCRLRQGRAEHP